MMNKARILAILAILSVSPFVAVEGAMYFKAESPEAVGSIIPAGDFTIDIWIDNDSVGWDWTGGVYSLHFYSPDGSIQNINHRDVGDSLSTKSLSFINQYLYYMNAGLFIFERSWNGILPDTLSLHSFGTMGINAALPDQPYLRFSFNIVENGQFCVDSIEIEAGLDWIFQADWDYVKTTFDGPYCWTIQSPNQPPVITCPSDRTLGKTESTSPIHTGYATAVDDNDANPTITYSDVVDNSGNPIVITRTWVATDSENLADTCVQIITKDASTDINIKEADQGTLPENFDLFQNYPNPFNPGTTIEFALPKATKWNLSVFDVAGRNVAEYEGFNNAGRIQVVWNASNQASGIYFYKLETDDYSTTRKMVLLK
jgi:hypothetical protein